MVWAVIGLSVALAGVALGWMLFGRHTPAPAAVQMADAGPSPGVAPSPAWTSPPPDPLERPAAPSTSPAPTVTAAAPQEPAAAAQPERPPADEPVRMRPPSREALQDETPPPVMQFSTVKPRVPAAAPAVPPAPAARAEAGRQPKPAGTAASRDLGAAVQRSPVPASAQSPDAPAQAPRVYTLHELPPTIRQQLPQLSVGGAMYSESPSSRMLILNGQPFKEGDQPIANLKLEQINLKSAVLSYKGYRYAINY